MKRENEPLWKLVKKIASIILAQPESSVEYGYDPDEQSYFVDAHAHHNSAVLSFTPLEDGNIEVRLTKWDENGEKYDKVSRNSMQFLFNPKHAQIWVNHILGK